MSESTPAASLTKWRVSALPAAYVTLYPMLAEVARANGYALGAHGSMARDFDLVAVPWTAEATDGLTLIRALKAAVGAVTHREGMDHHFPDCDPKEKPHGRMAYSLHFTNRGGEGP